MTSFKDTIMKLAENVATEATGESVAFGDRIDALAELTKLYIAMQKHPSDADDTGNHFDFEKGIAPDKEPPDGGSVTTLSTRRRRPA